MEWQCHNTSLYLKMVSTVHRPYAFWLETPPHGSLNSHSIFSVLTCTLLLWNLSLMWQVPTKNNTFNVSIQSLKYVMHKRSVFNLHFFAYEAIIHFHYANTVVKRLAKPTKGRKSGLRAGSYYFTCQLRSKAQIWWNTRGNTSHRRFLTLCKVWFL